MRGEKELRTDVSPHRISIKLFVAGSEPVDLGAIIPVFHRWIQQSKVPGSLIDVADYRHMADGPGVLLVGQDVDYGLDMTLRRPGLMHTRKRGLTGDLKSDLVDLARAAVGACLALEAEPSLGGKVRFRTDEVELTFRDRLHAPNEAATFDTLRAATTEVFDSIYEAASVRVERDGDDDRRCLTLRVTTSDAPDLKTLNGRLEKGVRLLFSFDARRDAIRGKEK